jgi:hypothetical protein
LPLLLQFAKTLTLPGEGGHLVGVQGRQAEVVLDLGQRSYKIKRIDTHFIVNVVPKQRVLLCERVWQPGQIAV